MFQENDILLAKKVNKQRRQEYYPSRITEEYFKDWGALKLEGNPQIKNFILMRIISQEKNYQTYYQNMADKLGITVEDFKHRLQVKVENLVAKSNFFIALDPEVLALVLNEGKFKSFFEKGPVTKGGFSQNFRSYIENFYFGFNDEYINHDYDDYSEEDEKITIERRGRQPYNGDYFRIYGQVCPTVIIEHNATNRPIYGYLSDEEHGVVNEKGKIPPPTNLSHYGRIHVKLKKGKVLKRTTITLGDSIDADILTPTPAIKPHFTSFPGKRLNQIERINQSSVLDEASGCYFEAQYHRQVTLDDVEAIYISEDNGLPEWRISQVNEMLEEYKKKHPESDIKIVNF